MAVIAIIMISGAISVLALIISLVVRYKTKSVRKTYGWTFAAVFLILFLPSFFRNGLIGGELIILPIIALISTAIGASLGNLIFSMLSKK